MPSNYEIFWNHHSYAIVGYSVKKKFPLLTFRALKKKGRVVYPIDPSVDTVDNEKAYDNFDELPQKVEAIILELPKEQTKVWVEKVANYGIKDLWLHLGTDTPEAIQLAKQNNINVRKGTCAVMYLTPGITYHSIHKWINKALKKW